MQHQKHFTLDEASQALARIKAQVEQIPKLKRQLDRLGYDPYKKCYTLGSLDSLKPFPPPMEELAALVTKLHNLGIIVKGLDEGLIDFPHRRANGDEVYLCWKVGEDALAFWHTVQDGFAGRRPLKEL
jgi:hypothetical protein